MKYKLIILLSLIQFNCLSAPLLAIWGTSKHHISNRNNTLASNRILKMGESCSYSSYFGNLFYLFYGPGGGIDEARDKAGITKIAVIDRSSFSLFPLYYEECTLVFGE
jgi:hypothetical protein